MMVRSGAKGEASFKLGKYVCLRGTAFEAAGTGKGKNHGGSCIVCLTELQALFTEMTQNRFKRERSRV